MTDIVVPPMTLPAGCRLVVSCWLVSRGEPVYQGDRLVELHAGPVTVDVASPAAGVVEELIADVDDPVAPGMLLGRLRPAAD